MVCMILVPFWSPSPCGREPVALVLIPTRPVDGQLTKVAAGTYREVEVSYS